MDYATQCQPYLDDEGQAFVDTAGKSFVSATPSPSVGRSTFKRWSIIASAFSVMLVIGLVTGPGYGARSQLGGSGLNVVSLVGEEVAVELALQASQQLANNFKDTLKTISSDIQRTRQELEAISSKKISIAQDKFEKFTADTARASALLVEMESDVRSLYNTMADIFQLNVDDLKQKLYVDDLETQKQAIRDARDTMRAAIDTALEELVPLQQKAQTALGDFTVLSETSVVFQNHLAEDEQGQSEWYNHRASDLRAKAYGGCVASVLGALPGLAICYGTAAGVLESYLADLRKEVQEVQQRMHRMGDLFGHLGAQCKVLQERATHEYKSMGEVKSKLIAEKNIIRINTVSFWKSRVLPLTRQLVALLRKKAGGKR